MKQIPGREPPTGQISVKELLSLQQGIIYGPIQSRRLGVSLGVNVLSTVAKICSFDCVYCQYGWTDLKTDDCPESASMKPPAAAAVLGAIEHALRKAAHECSLPDHLTFAGNGEPTLHPGFREIVEGAFALRNAIAPTVKLSILSNSSRVPDPGIRSLLARFDERYMKFDCGSAAVFERYNKPHSAIGHHLIIEGLRTLALERPITLQSLFCSGEAGNLTLGNVATWAKNVALIRPAAVHVYSLDRGFPETALAQATRKQLEQVASLLDPTGIPYEIF